MERFDPPCYKVASASLTDHASCAKMKPTGRPAHVSTGMSTLEEIEAAVAVAGARRPADRPRHLDLSVPGRRAEPAHDRHAASAAIPSCPIGYSGHETGLAPTWAAVALGATFVERHITLDRAMWGSDQAASVEVGGLHAAGRATSATSSSALGDGVKRVYAGELPQLEKLRRVKTARAPRRPDRDVTVRDPRAAATVIRRPALACVIVAPGAALPLRPRAEALPRRASGRTWSATRSSRATCSALVIGALIAWIDGARPGSRASASCRRWPLALQVAFFVVTHDLYIYWFHRWQHRSPLALAPPRGAPLERRASTGWPARARTRSRSWSTRPSSSRPMVLLGAAPEVPLVKGMISAVWGLWIHANVDVRTGWLQWIVNGPEAHRWHHARGRARPATGTSRPSSPSGTGCSAPPSCPRAASPAGYGLPEVDFPRGYVRQHLFAFRPFRETAGSPAAPSAPGGVPPGVPARTSG